MDFLVVLALVLVLGRLLLFVVTLFSSLVLLFVVAVCGPCILPVAINYFDLHPTDGPVRIFALAKGFPLDVLIHL